MKLIDIFKYAWNDLRKTKVSFGSNVIAISIGVVLITLMFAISFGIEKYIENELRKSSAMNALRLHVDKRNPEFQLIDEKMMEKLKRDYEGVKQVVPFVRTYVDAYIYPERKTLITLVGAIPDDPEVTRQERHTGRTNWTTTNASELVIPINVAREIEPANPDTLVEKEITLEAFRKKGGEESREQIKAQVVGLLKYSPEGRVYGPLHFVERIKAWQDWKFDNLKSQYGIVVTRDTPLNMRRTPTENRESIFKQLPKDTVVEILDDTLQFFKIRFEGEEGFVEGKYIQPCLKVEATIPKSDGGQLNIALIGLGKGLPTRDRLMALEWPEGRADRTGLNRDDLVSQHNAIFMLDSVAKEIRPNNSETLIGEQISLHAVSSSGATVEAVVADVFKPSDASLERQVYGWSEFVGQMSPENNRESKESPKAIGNAASKSQATYDSVMVHFDTIAHLEKQRPKIEAELGFVTSSILDEVKRIRNYVRLGKVITIALGLIALIIGSIGIWNSLHASVVRKTKEIGIIKALGASGKDIAFIFLAEAAIIGMTAGILGWFVGFIFIELAKSLLKLQLGTPLLVHPIWLPLAAVIISLAVSLGAALRPAIVAGKKEAMEAIRSL